MNELNLDDILSPENVAAIGGKDRWMYLSKKVDRPKCLFFTVTGEDLELNRFRIEVNFDDTELDGHKFIVWICVRGANVGFEHIQTLRQLIALYELWKGEPLPGIPSVLKPSAPIQFLQPVRISGDE